MKMKTQLSTSRHFSHHQRAFSLIEAMIASTITLVMFITFYAAITAGVTTIKVARENLRATQIMINRMEGIRLYTWIQLTNTTLLPTNFVESYYPSGTNGSQGINYTGAVSVASVALASPASSYSNNLYQVTIKLNWKSGSALRTRQMSTYSAKYGMQNYVWANAN